MPDCGLKVFDGSGALARDLRVQLAEPFGLATLDLVHQRCIQGLTCSYALLEHEGRLRGVFLHPQLLPPNARIFSARKRTPGRWITHLLDIGASSGGRTIWGPEIFFRQTDIDADRAWLAPLLLQFAARPSTRRIDLPGDPIWSWEVADQRYYYREAGSRWWLYGAGNTPLLRLEQAVHLSSPASSIDYLWSVGAIPLG